MAYNKTTWVSGETPLSAQNFNNIEEGIEKLYNGENEVEFESGDTGEEPVESVEVELLESGETSKTIIQKISNMFRNVRYLLKMMGDTDISGLSEEKTVTGAIAKLNSKLKWKLVNSVTGTDNIVLPNNYTELFVLASTSSNASMGTFIQDCLPDNKATHYLGGGYNSTDQHSVKVSISKNNINLLTYVHDNTNYVTTANMSVYYR